MDAKDGFHQVELDEESSYLTTFWTLFGCYGWLRMPFGIEVALKEYMECQKDALEGLERIEIIADDILVCGCGDTLQEATKSHDRHLKTAIGKMPQNEVKIEQEKGKIYTK